MRLPTDTGPLVALIDPSQSARNDCWRIVMTRPESAGGMVTTWPCMNEALYLLGRNGGYPLQAALLRLYEGGTLSVHTPQEGEMARSVALVHQYKNVPCDFADASLLSLCEVTGARTVFTLDSDFYIYRLTDGAALSIIPAP